MGGTAVTVIRKVRSRRSRDGDECVVGMRREQTPLCRPLPSECDPHPLFLHARHATTINVRLKVTHWSPFRPDLNPSFISIEIQLLVVLIRLVHGLKSKCPVTIDALSDDVLLEIFKIHLEENHSFWSPGIPIHEDLWFTLVHVCHRWRCLVSASPRTLDLKMLCTSNRPVKKMLDAWPALPIVIKAPPPWQAISSISGCGYKPTSSFAHTCRPSRS